ncbi:MAG: tetratricopeptide repeat protein, partial [Phycisphaerales bacterium]|nr:tetratricopeptide repeat protein [Phycisphaerales bacterium]
NLARLDAGQAPFEQPLTVVGATGRWMLFISEFVTQAETLQAIGEIRYAAKDFREALGSYYEALAICEANYGPESIEAANCLNYIGGSLIELHDHEAMAEVTRRRYNIFEKRLRGTGDFSLGVYQRELSDALCRAGRHEEAEEEGRAALAYLRSILGDEHREVAWCEGIIANLLACHGKLDEAETMAIDAATRYSRLDPNGRLTPLIKQGRDFIFALRGNFDAPELAEFKSRDLDYAFLAYVQNHPASADVFQRGAEHFELHGQTEAAAEWRTVAERAAAIGSPQVSR